MNESLQRERGVSVEQVLKPNPRKLGSSQHDVAGLRFLTPAEAGKQLFIRQMQDASQVVRIADAIGAVRTPRA